jgi:uncharacterized membrane protein YbjE (DUF340 family)
MIKYIIPALVIGASAGYVINGVFVEFPSFWVTDYLFNGSLYLLLFVMGLAFGIDREAGAKLKSKGLKILVFPFVVAVGSIVGGLLGGLIFGLNLYGSMAVTAGYGWYTLTGPLLAQTLGAEWGALGFAANFLRELITILSIPLMIRVDKLAPVASGGATTMDTTLPVIVRYCGSDVLITAFSSGFVLSLVAPFTVVAIASLA